MRVVKNTQKEGVDDDNGDDGDAHDDVGVGARDDDVGDIGVA